jgi:ketosteroid isomerase-like protein
VRRGFDAMSRGDVDAVLAEMAPAIEWYPTVDFAELGPFVGPAGIRKLMSMMLDAFDDFALEPQELVAVDDKVVAPVHQTGRGKGSGAVVEARYVLVFTFRDGKAVRVESFYDRDEALAAARIT